jgi:DNA helicase HerA-like ATPase
MSEHSPEQELEAFFGPRPTTPSAQRLGVVVGGSLSQGLEVKLDPQTQIEGLAVGRYVVIHGRTGRRFFSLIGDVALDAVNPMIEKSPPDTSDPFIAQVHRGTTIFGRIHVAPMLMLAEEGGEPQPVKTVPDHFSPVYEASPEDVALVFGDEEEQGYFTVGQPLDMEGIPVPINLGRFVERSAGVFGKTGTGKTFLTRLLLAGIIRWGEAVNLIFDMHNEYGWKTQDETRQEVKGLRQLFPTGEVSVFTLDETSSRRRGSRFDGVVRIGYDQIGPEDVDSLSSLMTMSDVQVGALYFLHRRLGRAWIARLLDEDDSLDELNDALERGTLHGGTLGAIQRKLGLFRRFEFLQPQVTEDPVQQILDYLDRGTNVVLEFGRFGNSMEAYILVANYITRRIHARYVDRKEAAVGGRGDEPRPLVITVEEAHKRTSSSIPP